MDSNTRDRRDAINFDVGRFADLQQVSDSARVGRHELAPAGDCHSPSLSLSFMASYSSPQKDTYVELMSQSQYSASAQP